MKRVSGNSKPALDATGHLSAWQTAATWHYDNVPPTGTLTIAGSGETVRSLNVTLNLVAEDADSALRQSSHSRR